MRIHEMLTGCMVNGRRNNILTPNWLSLSRCESTVLCGSCLSSLRIL